MTGARLLRIAAASLGLALIVFVMAIHLLGDPRDGYPSVNLIVGSGAPPADGPAHA